MSRLKKAQDLKKETSEQLKEVQAKAQRATSALGKRECGPEAMPPARLLEAFANTDAGVPRESTDAVQRAAHSGRSRRPSTRCPTASSSAPLCSTRC